MCGIAGIISPQGDIKKETIKQMTDIMSHRGPDGEGHYVTNCFVFGHRRLSVIDLSDAGCQPMKYLNRYVITYNGEIYNHIEIKIELIREGYQFNSQTDTEIIMAAYDYWGSECVKKFNGMWSFVIHDNKTNKFFISRDRFGMKPLYYFVDRKIFIFASEIKAILQHDNVKAEPNMEYLAKYLEEGPKEYINETAFKKIYRFPFSSYLVASADELLLPLSTTVFWEINPSLHNEIFSQKKANELAKQYYDLLSDSVRLRLRADVKVGSTLSGGLDSSSIVYLVNQHLEIMGKKELQETFSTVYKTNGTLHCDESKYIDLLVEDLKVNTNQIEPKEKDVQNEYEKVIWHMENPPENTCISGWHTFKKVFATDVVVTLDGQGADEQLAGYYNYLYIYLISLSLMECYREAFYYLKMSGTKMYILRALIMNHFKAIFGKNIFKKVLFILKGRSIEDNLNQALANSINTSLITLFHYSDRESMGHSIESRMPFMDYRLVEFLASVAPCYKMHHGWTKYLARLAFNGKLPDKICWRKDKMGWPIPEKYWFRGNLNKWLVTKVLGSKLIATINGSEYLDTESNSKVSFKKSIRQLNVAIFEKIFMST